jgi:SH3-like domain-containing protein
MLEKSKKIIITLFFLFYLPTMAVAESATGASTGLPVPRFVSLKSDEVNVRTGPGTRYPIQWLYRRDGLPVEIVEEFDLWRKIRDIEGATGWVHKSMLEGSRRAFIRGKEAQVVRANPEADARPLLKAEPMVITDVMECEVRWCRVQVSGRKGWIEKKHLWGVYPDEVFD